MTDKIAYDHFEIINISVKGPSRPRKDLFAIVEKDGRPVRGVGGDMIIRLNYKPAEKEWKGLWPVSWNMEAGGYTVAAWAKTGAEPHKIEKIAGKTAFKINTHKLVPLMPGFSVASIETMRDLKKAVIVDPYGEYKDWRGLLDWAKYLGVDSVWMLAGQTSAYEGALDEAFPWNPGNMSMLDEIGRECHARGLKYGVWIAAYLTVGPREYAADYDYALKYDPMTESFQKTRYISIMDDKRKKDIIKLLESFENNRNIDYIGVDYLRHFEAGFDIADNFIDEMDIGVPEKWTELDPSDRMLWLYNKILVEREYRLREKWDWWRSRSVALILKEIKRSAGISKPFWVFMLTWKKGHQHGQDPVMFTCAGADFTGLMLYEANNEQYETIIEDWHEYIKSSDANLILGDVLDHPLHQNTIDPSGPEEYYNRMMHAISYIYKDMPARSVFIHCLARAFWGRKGPYDSKEWLFSAGSVLSRLREITGKEPLETSIILNRRETVGVREITGYVNITNTSGRSLSDLDIEIIVPENVEITQNGRGHVDILPPGGAISWGFELKIKEDSESDESAYMIVSRVQPSSGKNNFCFKYIKFVDLYKDNDPSKI